jgi:guanylate kinase
MSKPDIIRRPSVFCLIGPAGSGKTTLADHLAENFATTLSRVITTTSRVKREGEVEGESYYFVDRQTFEDKVNNHDFFEWEETHGNFYGTSYAALQEIEDRGEDLLLNIDIRGALNFKRNFPERTVIVFLMPPSIQVLKERVLNRGTGIEETEHRLQTAEREYREALESASEIDYVIVNDKLEDSQNQIRSIVFAERVRLSRYSSEMRKRIFMYTSND